jgi:membrane associated rhomboid family serine protease
MKHPGSALLLGALAAGFALELWCAAPGNARALYALGALPDDASLQRQWWRLLSYGFLHWGWAHLLANAALLAWVAPVLERRVGAGRLLALFVMAAWVSGLSILCKHAWWPAPGVSVGASGGAFALLAAATLQLWREPQSPRRARIALAAICVGGLLVSLWPGISLVGHLAGAAVGALFALSPASRSPHHAPSVMQATMGEGAA